MSDIKALERNANMAARDLMGDVAWPTILLGLACVVGYFGCLYLALNHHVSLITTYAVTSLATYAVYTVMHDAVQILPVVCDEFTIFQAKHATCFNGWLLCG